MKKLINLTLAALLLLPVPASTSCHVRAVVVKKAVVVEKVAVAAFVAVPVAVPVYPVAAAVAPAATVTYTPPPPPPTCEQELAVIRKEFALLQAQFNQLAAGRISGKAEAAPAPMARAQDVPRAVQIIEAKCAACHEAAAAKEKGKGFVLFEANKFRAEFSGREMLSLQRKVFQGKMPPKDSGHPPLSPEETAEILNWIEGLK